MSFIDLINFAGVVSGFTVAVLGFFITSHITYIEKNTRRFFMIFFGVLTLYTLCDSLSQVSLIFLGPDFGLFSKLMIFGESLFSSFLMLLLTCFILFCSKCRIKGDPFFAVAFILWCIYLLLLIVTQFTTFIYYVTDYNVYNRGPLYPVLLIPPVLIMIVNFFMLLKKRAVLSSFQKQAFFLYLAIPLACMLIQMCWYGLLMTVLGTSVAAFLMFLFILREQTDLYVRQREEISDQRLSIMVLQMRPHFIYNTLMSIYYLCAKDPDKAQQVTYDFTNYLRKNFNAISRNGTIPFYEELEHTKAYLAVEKARYENSLMVEYDISENPDFLIPPLTLQPIVENAVKYGLDPELEPLHILVCQKKSEDGNEIIVEDTGPGFKPDEQPGNDEPHIALGNIRERLEFMCGGSLTILPKAGGGTVVRIFIPK